MAAPGPETQPAAFGHKSPLGPPTGPDLLSTALPQKIRQSPNPLAQPCNAAADHSPATQLPETNASPTSAQRQNQKKPALRAGLLHGRRPNLALPAQSTRQKSHAGLQPYLLQLEPKMQCSEQAQLQSAITDSQLCSHVTRCAAAQIQFGIQSLRSAVTTSDLPVSAPPHITDQICQLCAQSHSQSQITAQCSAHMS